MNALNTLLKANMIVVMMIMHIVRKDYQDDPFLCEKFNEIKELFS